MQVAAFASMLVAESIGEKLNENMIFSIIYKRFKATDNIKCIEINFLLLS